MEYFRTTVGGRRARGKTPARCRMLLAMLSWTMMVLAPRVTLASDPHNPPTAEALFRAGREAFEQQDFDVACQRFAESLRHDPALGTELNLALCEEKRQHLASAWEHLQTVLQGLPESDDRRPIALAATQRIEPKLSWVTLELAPGAPPVDVEFEGIALGRASFGVPLPVDAGAHTLKVRAEGRQDATLTFSVAIAERSTVRVQPGPPQPVQASPNEAAPPGNQAPNRAATSSPFSGDYLGPVEPPQSPVRAYVALGVGAAGLATGAVAGVLALDRQATVDRECDDERRCSPEGLEADRSGSRLALVSSVGFAAGLLSSALGVYWLIDLQALERGQTGSSQLFVSGSF